MKASVLNITPTVINIRCSTVNPVVAMIEARFAWQQSGLAGQSTLFSARTVDGIRSHDVASPHPETAAPPDRLQGRIREKQEISQTFLFFVSLLSRTLRRRSQLSGELRSLLVIRPHDPVQTRNGLRASQWRREQSPRLSARDGGPDRRRLNKKKCKKEKKI